MENSYKIDAEDFKEIKLCTFLISKRIFNQFKFKCKQNKTTITKELNNFIIRELKGVK